MGIGLDTISHKFVLNEETQADFENAFCQARDAAYEEAIEDAINDIEEETENTLKIIELDDEVSDKELRMIDARAISEQQLIGERIDNECTKLELQGFKRVAYDSDEVVEFDSVFASDILERGGNNIIIEGIAKYLGASVKVAYKGRNDFDYRDIYYKKGD